MKRSVIGILAHVDAGKTTLSEAMLYTAGCLRNLGRVDHGNAFLDNFVLERERGITIFSKQAQLNLRGMQATLLDTPGHIDFSPEMERTLSVLDGAILVISAPSGVQSHTLTVWKLLREHRIPTLLFINKEDLPNPGRIAVMEELKQMLGEGCVPEDGTEEERAMGHEDLLEEYLNTGHLSNERFRDAVVRAEVFPCWFGSALKLEGIGKFLEGIIQYIPAAETKESFAARVYKITRDGQNVRLTHLKLTGGILRVRDTVSGNGWEEKITAMRVYSGARFKSVDIAYPGDVVAVVGLQKTSAGMGLGAEKGISESSLEPVITYRVLLPDGIDPYKAMLRFKELEEEEPQLHVDWSSRYAELRVRLMGRVQLEVMERLVKERFGYPISFGTGSILYRETIAAPVEGVGHYEPLRHYAEVHLLMEPAARGNGITVDSLCREDDLDGNWQRLIMTHLMEKQHLGVLTGAPITDINIHLVSGRAHLKHTEGGDFREATYRAVRQGLMQAKSILLEPWYTFTVSVPTENFGRVLTDLERMGAETDPPVSDGKETTVSGRAPVADMQDYSMQLASFTHGLGRFNCGLEGYRPCQSQEKVIEEAAYQPEADPDNSPDSIFCANGAGFLVKWNQVPQYMHLPSVFELPGKTEPESINAPLRRLSSDGDDELIRIFEHTYGPLKGKSDQKKAMRPTEKNPEPFYKGEVRPQGPEYLLIDGYNIIFAWNELEAVAKDHLEHAREILIDRMRNYQGMIKTPVILVFDAYRVKGNHGSLEMYDDLAVVYTREAETADMYIEKVTKELGRHHKVRVATSDGLEQVIILSHGALRLPASEFHREVLETEKKMRELIAKKSMISRIELKPNEKEQDPQK